MSQLQILYLQKVNRNFTSLPNEPISIAKIMVQRIVLQVAQQHWSLLCVTYWSFARSLVLIIAHLSFYGC